jgi:hypothetical protein
MNSRYDALEEKCMDLKAKVRNLRAERDARQAFKDYVHERLDQAGIPTHTDGEHSKAGCRVGDRLDVLIGERDQLRSEWERLREALGKHADQHDMMAKMAGRVSEGSPVYAIVNGKRVRRKFADVVRDEAVASASHARGASCLK